MPGSAHFHEGAVFGPGLVERSFRECLWHKHKRKGAKKMLKEIIALSGSCCHCKPSVPGPCVPSRRVRTAPVLFYEIQNMCWSARYTRVPNTCYRCLCRAAFPCGFCAWYKHLGACDTSSLCFLSCVRRCSESVASSIWRRRADVECVSA